MPCWAALSRVWLLMTPCTVASQTPRPWNLSDRNTGVGCISFPRSYPCYCATLGETTLFLLNSVSSSCSKASWHCGWQICKSQTSSSSLKSWWKQRCEFKSYGLCKNQISSEERHLQRGLGAEWILKTVPENIIDRDPPQIEKSVNC